MPLRDRPRYEPEPAPVNPQQLPPFVERELRRVADAFTVFEEVETKKQAEIYNVKDYKAVGDGVTDDTTVIQEVIDLAAADTYDGIVYFPPGIYLCGDLTLASGVKLIGAGRENTTLKWTGGDVFIFGNGDTNTLIRGFTIDGDNKTFTTSNRGLLTFFATSATFGTAVVEDCRIVNSTYHGIMQWSTPVVVRNSEIMECDYYGIYGHASVGSTTRESLHVESCFIHDCSRNGIQVGDHGAGASYDGAAFISNCYIYNIDDADAGSGANGNAILIYRAANAQLIGNHCRACYSTGIRVNDADNVVILGGRYQNIGEVGIFVEFGAVNCQIIGANVYQCRNGGIFLTNVAAGLSGLVEGCVVKDVGVTGYGFGGSTTATPVTTGYGIYSEFGRVIGNYVEDIDGDTQGIGIGAGVGNAALNVRISNNEVRNCEYGIGFGNGGTSKSGPVFIHDNDLYSIATADFTAVSGAGKDPTAITDANMLDVFIEDNYPSREWQNFSDGDTTPAVTGGKRFKTANTGATTITDFDLAHDGQEIVVVAGDANTTLDFTASALKGNDGADLTMAAGDVVKAIYNATDASWYCTVGLA